MEKYRELVEYLKGLKRVAVACSGGVDSTYLLMAAGEAFACNPLRVKGFMALSCFQDREAARRDLNLVRSLGVEVETLVLDPLSVPEIAKNTTQRCYYCKRYIFSHLCYEAKKMGDDVIILEGSNADDNPEERPGSRALKELKVISPLRELGIHKSDIRSMLKERLVDNWEKPSQSCLATRIPTGCHLRLENLVKVSRCEEVVRSLGFRQCRVRISQYQALIEVLKEEIPVLYQGRNMDIIREGFSAQGIDRIRINHEGFHPERVHEPVEYMNWNGESY